MEKSISNEPEVSPILYERPILFCGEDSLSSTLYAAEELFEFLK